MSRTTDPIGHWEDPETWLSVATDSLLPKAAETLKHQTQDQLDDNITSLMRQDPSQSYSHKELAKITGSLSHTLITTFELGNRHAAHLQQELTCAQQRVKQLELEAQERREGPDEVEQSAEEEITRLKETLTATTQEMEQVKVDYADLSNRLQYAEQLLKKANADFRDKNGRIKALETHLDESRKEISSLTRQLDYIKEESYSFREELRHAYELHPEPPRTRRAPGSPLPSRPGSPLKETAPASHRSSHGLDLKDLDKLPRNIGKFTPSVPGSQDIQAYLQDIDFHLEMRPNVTDKDRLYLLRTTSSSEVCSFLEWQPAHTKTDYNLLREALIKEFADPESKQGLVAALEMKQGRHESPQAYYSQLRRAYFGTRNEQNMEEDVNFKTLVLRNLHPGVSHHLGVLACPRTMRAQQLRDLAHKAYGKQKMASEKGAKTPAVLDFNTQSQGLALEGAQYQDHAKPSPKEWNTPLSNRERYSHAGTRPKQRNNRWDGPHGQQHSPGRHWEKSWDSSRPHENHWERLWNQPSSRGKNSWEFNGTSKGNRQTHPGATSPRNRKKTSQRFQAENPVPQLLGDLIEKGIARKFYLSIIIKRHFKVKALLDTGANITLMSTELFEEVQERTKRSNSTLKLQRCELNLQAFSHTGLQLKHMAPIHLTVGPMDLVHTVYISPLNTYPLLIGKDLLNHFEPLIDFKHLKIWTQVREPLPFQSVDSESQCQDTDTTANSLTDDAMSRPGPNNSKQQEPGPFPLLTAGA
ncbi:LOW QUALITY PROTEIN: uncharacterized protein LOC109092092 [Cyprinus carpio]|uniref:LOW QUALITY PROTEIN: uncharacterized protein LOC109092092 n=1 Tax=Cyprinus carpio TaxID=7962 RepID=A0A9R0AEA4_CYPCA|nr:LOW QUALITY PROTEIN: uncharacterized protein LOC109092092 [Cyprinus carpio]